MFTRLANIFRGFMSLFIKGIEKRNPEALLELEQENLRKQIGSYNQSLAGACRPRRAPDEPGAQAGVRGKRPARQDQGASARRQPVGGGAAMRCGCRPSRANWRKTASSWRKPRTPTRT
jgi:hypothetical protein